MKYTRIPSDLAYKYYKEGKVDLLYFRSNAAPFEPTNLIHYSNGGTMTRRAFRSLVMYIGCESPKVTIKQMINCYISDSDIPAVHDIIVKAETGKSTVDFPLSHSFSESIRTAAWKAGTVRQKYILFDVDELGEKSNFRFEDPN